MIFSKKEKFPELDSNLDMVTYIEKRLEQLGLNFVEPGTGVNGNIYFKGTGQCKNKDVSFEILPEYKVGLQSKGMIGCSYPETVLIRSFKTPEEFDNALEYIEKFLKKNWIRFKDLEPVPKSELEEDYHILE